MGKKQVIWKLYNEEKKENEKVCLVGCGRVEVEAIICSRSTEEDDAPKWVVYLLLFRPMSPEGMMWCKNDFRIKKRQKEVFIW